MSALALHDLGGDGPALLLVHGYTGSSRDFLEVGGQLTELRRVFVVDQLGHGESPRAPRYSVGILTRAILDTIMVDIGRPVDIVAHSMGGPVTLPIAIHHPDLVRSLVLMDTYADPPDREPENADFVAMLERPVDEAFAAVVEEWSTNLSDEELLFRERRGAEWAETRTALDREQVDPLALVQLGLELFRDTPSFLADCAAITCPTSVIVGEHDAPFRGPSARLVETISGARLHVIPGAYHSPQHSHPDEWLAIVRDHLERAG